MKRKDQWKEYYKDKLELTVHMLMDLLKSNGFKYVRRQSGYRSRHQITVVFNAQQLREKIERLKKKIGGYDD